jgi:hypothetical protein
LLPWFHYSKAYGDILMNSAVVMVNQTQVQLNYHWNDIDQPQRIYTTCNFQDERCCEAAVIASGLDCFNAPSTGDAFRNLLGLALLYTFLAVSQFNECTLFVCQLCPLIDFFWFYTHRF